MVHRRDGEILTLPTAFESLVEKLDHPMFVRCHNSFLISLDAVQSYQADCFTMADGAEIPISRSYRQTCKQQFLKWQEIWI